MVSLGYHVALLVAGLLALFLTELQPPLVELPWWSGALLLALVPLVSRAARRYRWRPPLGRLFLILALLAPLLIELAVLFLTDYPAKLQAWMPWPSVPGWTGLSSLPLLLPLAIAHLALMSRPGEPFWASLVSRENVRARLGLFAWCVLLVYLGLSSLVMRMDMLRIWVEESSLAALIFSVVSLGLLLVVVPRLLLLVLDTIPIEGFLRRQAEDVTARLGVRSPRLLEWRTGDEFANAMVLAMPFAPRPILFTDAFLGQLSFEQFRAVLAHELGHVAGRHVGVFVSLLLGCALSLEALGGSLLEGLFGGGLALVLLVGLALAIGFVSRRLELEADLYALEVMGNMAGLEGALLHAGGQRRRRGGWRHFSTVRRMVFLRAASHDPGVGARLRAWIRSLRRISLALLLFGILATLWSAWQRAPVEQFWIDVRLGHMQAAEGRLADLEPGDFVESTSAPYAQPEAWSRLVDRIAFGAELESAGESLDFAHLGWLTSAALAGDDLPRAYELIELARLIAAPGAQALVHLGEPTAELELEDPSWQPVEAWFRRSP